MEKIVLYDDKGVQQDEIEVDRKWMAEEMMTAARNVLHTSHYRR